ncbi:MAG: class II aldolase/adducin family protein [Clostridiales bacterium]|nr:class II aldolase/adducin family protein [Clostridiales bacterium]MBQ4638695.1 class II aldolase/adducin family protein [Clostridia bacterium]
MHELQKKYEAQIIELVEAAHKTDAKGFVTSQGGNLSFRVDENVVLITPTKVAKRSVQFDDVCIVDMDGNTLFASTGRKPTGELPFHLRILKKRPDIKAVLHAHPPVLTGFAITGQDYMERAFLPEPVIEVGPMLMVPYAEPLSDELAEMFDAYVERSNGFLMENHGAIMCSYEGIGRALELLEMMEAAAQSILVAVQLGNAKTIPLEDVKNLDRTIKTRGLPMPGLPGKVETLLDIYK